jgi:hypothetical protein
MQMGNSTRYLFLFSQLLFEKISVRFSFQFQNRSYIYLFHAIHRSKEHFSHPWQIANMAGWVNETGRLF